MKSEIPKANLHVQLTVSRPPFQNNNELSFNLD